MPNEEKLFDFELEYLLVRKVPSPKHKRGTSEEVESTKWHAQYETIQDAESDLIQLIRTKEAFWKEKGVPAKFFSARLTPLE